MAIGVKTPGSGRKKGTANKVNAALKEMILGALDKAGGQEYLFLQAAKNPNAFLQLIGKVLPLTLAGSVDGNQTITFFSGVPRCKDGLVTSQGNNLLVSTQGDKDGQH